MYWADFVEDWYQMVDWWILVLCPMIAMIPRWTFLRVPPRPHVGSILAWNNWSCLIVNREQLMQTIEAMG